MRDRIMSWKVCAIVLLVCAAATLLQGLIDAEIESHKVVSEGSCAAATLRLAGDLADSVNNDFVPPTLVLMLDCDGRPYATSQSDVILARESYGHSVFVCTRFANDTAKCEVPKQAAAAK